MDRTHSVHPIRQPNLNDCWATCAAMLLRLHGGANAGVEEIKRRASAAGVPINPNGSISPSSVPSLARALRLRLYNMASPPQPITTRVMSRVLQNSCAAAFGFYNYPGTPTSAQHVLLFYRISGADANPMVYFVDPFDGRRHHYLVNEINEAVGSVDYFLYQ